MSSDETQYDVNLLQRLYETGNISYSLLHQLDICMWRLFSARQTSPVCIVAASTLISGRGVGNTAQIERRMFLYMRSEFSRFSLVDCRFTLSFSADHAFCGRVSDAALVS